MYVECPGFLHEVAHKAYYFVVERCQGVREALEPERRRGCAEKWILETTGSRPVVVQKLLYTLKEPLGGATGEREFTCRALKGPEQMLGHMPGGHLAPMRWSALGQAGKSFSKMMIEERRPQLGIIDIKWHDDHAGMPSFPV